MAGERVGRWHTPASYDATKWRRASVKKSAWLALRLRLLDGRLIFIAAVAPMAANYFGDVSATCAI